MPYAQHINAVYKIVNTKTGVCYVGQSQNVSKRLKEHMRMLRSGTHNNIYLQRAFDAYGQSAFRADIEVICASPEDLDSIEEAFLSGEAYFDTPCVYNLASFAKAPMRGKRHSADVRAKISQSRKLTKFDYGNPEFRAKLSESHKTRFFNDPRFVAKLKFILENEGMSYAERARTLGSDTSSVRKLAVKYAHLKGEL